MKLTALHESKNIDAIVDKTMAYIQSGGMGEHPAVFKTLDSLGIKDLKDRIKIGNEIKKEMILRRKSDKKKRMKEIPSYFFL